MRRRLEEVFRAGLGISAEVFAPTTQIIRKVRSLDFPMHATSFRIVAWTPYLTAITKILARNQITNGGPGKRGLDRGELASANRDM